MIDSIFMANERGDRLIERYYRGKNSKQIIRAFRHQYIATKKLDKPVIRIDDTFFLHIKVDEVHLVACSNENCNPALVFQFLHQLAKIFREYFEKLNPTTIRDHFVIIYELLDECVDHGYPQLTSGVVLKRFIQLGTAISGVDALTGRDAKSKGKLTAAITGIQEWRPDKTLRYEKNEVFIDVVEHVDLLLSTKGGVLRSDVTGQILMKTKLSGTPQCKLGLNDRLRLNKEKKDGKVAPSTESRDGKRTKGIAIDDLTFHRCVRLGRFDQDRTIHFVPPDGEFELMSYRITRNVQLPFRVIPVVTERGRNRVEYDIKVKPNFSSQLIANDVVIKIPVPENSAAKAKHIKARYGKTKYYPQHSAIIWKFRRFPGSVKQGYSLRAEIRRLHSVSNDGWVRPPITMQFKVPMFMSSGLHVRFLRVVEAAKYTTVKWVRYITQHGQYQIRI